MASFIIAWEWVKKHWQLLLTGLGIVLAFLFGFEAKKRPVVVTGVDPVKDDAEKATKVAIQQAQVQHDTVVAQAEQEARAADAAVVAQEEKTTTSIEQDVDKTNQYLHDVSKEIGGKG